MDSPRVAISVSSMAETVAKSECRWISLLASGFPYGDEERSWIRCPRSANLYESKIPRDAGNDWDSPIGGGDHGT